MLCVAALLDGIGYGLLLLSWLGIDDYGILDIFGAVLIGGWMFMRGGGLNNNFMKKGLKRLGIGAGVELIPIIGGLAPAWTILVWRELNSE